MIQQIFAIYDDKALTYSPPFFQITKGLAVRAFTQTAGDKKTTIGLHPTDFTLFHLGEYDDQTGKFHGLKTPESIMKANEAILPDTHGNQINLGELRKDVADGHDTAEVALLREAFRKETEQQKGPQ